MMIINKQISLENIVDHLKKQQWIETERHHSNNYPLFVWLEKLHHSSIKFGNCIINQTTQILLLETQEELTLIIYPPSTIKLRYYTFLTKDYTSIPHNSSFEVKYVFIK